MAGTNYVIATRDNGDNRLYYYTGSEAFHGGNLLGNVLEAKRFRTWDALMDFLRTAYDYAMGFSVIEIPNCTFKALEESKSGDGVLYSKYHDPNYAIR